MALTVLQLLPALEEGGVERGTVEICQALLEAGHQPLVVSAGGRLVAHLEALGVEHLCWPVGRKSPLGVRWIPRLGTLYRERRIDIVHARSRLPAWLGYLAWRGAAGPVRPRFVTTVHGFYSVGRYSEIMTRGERVIAVSESIRDYLQRSYPRLDMRRVEVIHRGVDPAAFPRGHRPDADWTARWRRAHPALEGRFVIVLAGRLRRLKGHHELLDLVASLVAEGLDAHALIVGDDRAATPYIRELKSRVQREGLPVTFLGFRDDLREIYAVADVVLSLSTQPESFGRTVLEPLCLGTPVVGYRQGGVGEVLDAMYPYGGVAPGDREALVRRVAALARERVPVTASNAYPLERMQQRTVALYERLAAGEDAGPVAPPGGPV